MNISDGTKKIIIIIFIAIVLLLPYYFLISPIYEKKERVATEIEQLRERYKQLSALEAKRDEFITGTDEFNAKSQAIIDRFPADIQQEATIMFLIGAENDVPVSLYKVAFNRNEGIPISGETMESAPAEAAPAEGTDEQNTGVVITTTSLAEGYEGITSKQSVTYEASYKNFKGLINYIEQWKDRLTITDLTATYITEDDIVTGSFVINQYAISGNERVFDKTNTDVIKGTENIFDTQYRDTMTTVGNEVEAGSLEQTTEDKKPDTTKPDTTKEEDKKPDTTKPDTTKEEEKKPDTTKPDTTKEEEKKPDTTKPDTTKEEEKKPDTTKPDTAKEEDKKTDNSDVVLPTDTYDVFMMLNQPKANVAAKVVGLGSDKEGKYNITSDTNQMQRVRFTFEQEDGVYYVVYKVGYNASDKHEIKPGTDIILNVYSSVRADSNDKVGASIAIENNTDKTVKISVLNDDSDESRVEVREKTGKVTVQ